MIVSSPQPDDNRNDNRNDDGNRGRATDRDLQF